MIQLHDAITKLGCESEVVFYDSGDITVHEQECSVKYNEGFSIPEMANITPRVCTRFCKDDVLIFPEVRIKLLTNIRNAGFRNTVFWWLSWNNADLQVIDRLDYAESLLNTIHLFQSHFAHEKAREHDFDGLMVSDYTLFDQDTLNVSTQKKYDVCFFPLKAKGAERTLGNLSQGFRIKKIEKMPQSEVINVLRESKFFLDFGRQPGKDRIPREATIQGCIPIVRRVGAARNNVDVPIPDILKPSTAQMLDANYLKQLMISLDQKYDNVLDELDAYKQSILVERETFMKEVQNFIESY